LTPAGLEREVAAVIDDVSQRDCVAHEASPILRRGPRDAPTDRRHFLCAAFGTSVLAVAAVVSPVAALEAEASDPGAEESRGRYRESDHVKAFYRTNGYETLNK